MARRKREQSALFVKKLDPIAANIADQMTDDQKKSVAAMVVDGAERDERSCSGRRRRQVFWRKQYSGNMDPPSAKRGQYTCTAHLPVNTMPAMQFRSRAREYLLPSRGIAQCKGTGAEDAGRAERCAKTLQYLLERKTAFRKAWDSALLPCAIDGSVFLKVRWTDTLEVSAVPSEDFVVSYTHSGTIEQAARVTHRLRMTKDDIRKRVNDGLFCEEGWDLKAGQPLPGSGLGAIRRTMDGHQPDSDDPDLPREIFEQYRNLDLDGDGIGEPYVVTVDRESRTLLRVVSRVVNGETLNPWVMLPFEPSPESFYPLGMGHLLEGLAIVADSIIQQLVDWGSRAINPPGFVSKRAFKKPGEVTYEMGTLIEMDGPVQDLKDHIMFLPIPGQPTTMQQTLTLVLEEANKISSVTDIMQGIAPTNQTATTSLVVAKQSLTLFNSVFSRLRDAMTEVLQKSFQLIRLYLDDSTYSELLGDTGQPEYRAWQQQSEAFMVGAAQLQMAQEAGAPPEQLAMMASQLPPMPAEYPFTVGDDFRDTIDVYPTADPEVTSEVERMSVAEKAFQLVTQNPALPPTPQTAYAATRRMLEALRVPNIDEILEPPPQPGPPPNVDQTEELANLLEGKPMVVLPEQDHAQHLREIAAFEEKDGGWWLAQFDPAQKEALMRHMREHMAWILRQGAQSAGPEMGIPAGAPPPAAAGGPVDVGAFPGGGMAPGGVGAGGGDYMAPPQLVGRIAADLHGLGAGPLVGS